jgi:hypothetical protein
MKSLWDSKAFIFCSLALSIPLIGRSGKLTAPAQASVNGKYVNLLYIIEVPYDRAEYGDSCEWGYWTGAEYSDRTNLKPGFWVWIYPKWYVWEKLAVEGKVNDKASANGKYQVLLQVLEVPGDAAQYGQFYDWGFSEEYSYAGYEELTPGYWVYASPNWYIWAEAKSSNSGT